MRGSQKEIKGEMRTIGAENRNARMKPKALFDNPVPSLLCAEKVEGQFYERKSKRDPDDLAKTICAFANSNKEGGLLAIGISDNGKMEGLLHRTDLNINRLLEYHYYTGTLTIRKFVDCVNIEGERDQILLIYVPYLEGRVAETSNGKAYIRQGDKTVELRDTDKRELEYTKGQISFEDELVCEYRKELIVEDILNEIVKSIQEKDGVSSDIRVEQLLLSHHLLKDKNGKSFFTNAGLLLLAKDPKQNLPGAYVRFIRYEGIEKKAGQVQNVIKDETFVGPLPRLIQRVREYISSQVKEFSYLGSDGKFVKEPEYPPFAWQEAVVNALIHRSYSASNAPVFIEMFDDRIEVRSPGDYPAGVSPREFIHNPRNPHLMETMRYLDFVRMVGEGSLRMKQEMEKANLPVPDFSRPRNPYVKVILRNDIERRQAERIGKKPEVTGFTNLFRITWTAPAPNGPVPDERLRPPDESELREAIFERMKELGYAIDSFTSDTAIDFSDEYVIPEIKNEGLVSIYPGFLFQLMRFKDGYYLCLDHTIEVRNKATLDRILSIAPELSHRRFKKGFLKKGKEWLPCFIREVNDDKEASIELFGKSGSINRVSIEHILPLLPTAWIAELISKAGIRFDLYRKIKQLSFSSSQNAARERAEQTKSIAQKLVEELFPLNIRDYQVNLNPEPQRLSGRNMEVKQDITETMPVFNKDFQAKADTVINGLTKYGSYDRPGQQIPLVLLATPKKMDQMLSLVRILQQGSMRFKGMEAVFALSFDDPIKIEADSPDKYLSKCRQMCASIPSDSMFLIYCPEKGYSRADYSVPYYQVKHFLLEAGFPSQMVDDDTLVDPAWKDYNLALDIFAKAGCVPWVLSEGLPNADLFLGLSYSAVRIGQDIKRLMAYVNVFDRYGKWLYYKGNTRPIDFERRNKYFRDILREVTEEYQKKAKLQRLHVHYGFKLSHMARREIAAGVKDIAPEAEISFVYINRHGRLRLYDENPSGNGSLRRGSYIPVSPNQFYISTTGYNDLGQKGIGTPHPLDVTVNRLGSIGDLDLRIYAQHILSLTKLNWASTKTFCREPITIKFANDIAYLMNVFLSSFGEFNLNPKLETTPWFL